MPTTEANPRQSLDSEQISPATIAHHAVYEKTPNLQLSHVCQWGAQPSLVGPLSRLVGKPPFSPSLRNNVLPLTKAANCPNRANSLTQAFDRILFYVCNSRYFGVKKQKTGTEEQSCLPQPSFYFQVFPWHFCFMRRHSLAELTENGNSAAEIMVPCMYICVLLHSCYINVYR